MRTTVRRRGVASPLSLATLGTHRAAQLERRSRDETLPTKKHSPPQPCPLCRASAHGLPAHADLLSRLGCADLADFNSELPLYQQAGALIEVLLHWQPAGATLPARLEELYILMYELNLLGLKDVKLAQSWLADLIRIGYRFPEITTPYK